jgi:hypothetical protein
MSRLPRTMQTVITSVLYSLESETSSKNSYLTKSSRRSTFPSGGLLPLKQGLSVRCSIPTRHASAEALAPSSVRVPSENIQPLGASGNTSADESTPSALNPATASRAFADWLRE